MGIKHKRIVGSGEEGMAIDWNDEHKIDSDVNFAGHSGINLGEPVSPSDIATKNYVDVQAGGIADYATRSFSTSNPADGWGNNTITNISVSVSFGQKVLIISSGTLIVGTNDWIQLRLARNSLGFTNPMAELDDDSNTGPKAPFSLCYLDIPGSGTFTYGIQSNFGGLASIDKGYILATVFN